jgi:hypothetical protein
MITHSSVHIFVPSKHEELACSSPAAAVKALTAGATAHSSFGEGRHAILTVIYRTGRIFYFLAGAVFAFENRYFH